MPSKKSTKVLPGCLDPQPPESLGSLVHDHQFRPVVTAEYMGRSVSNPTFGADLVRVESQGGTSGAGSAVETIGHQFIGIFWAKARIERIAPAAGGANHPLGEGP